MSGAAAHSLVRRLGKVPIFSQLDDRSLLRVLGASANLVWTDGRDVFRAGDPAEALYIVISGGVAIIDGDRHVIDVPEDGWFGEMSLLHPDARHTKTARAKGETELMVIRREWFEAMLESETELAAHFRRALEERGAGPQADEVSAG
ncbi:MAG TPA: cyclic nucleotide-binding domain-containing protein [Actinomycetota bacterium]|nr:cyclic nucleotide-binding domain-containing protein [Actinomycetota bacterium]